MRENNTPSLAAGNTLQAHDKDEQILKVANLQQVVTPTEMSPGIDGKTSSGAHREFHGGQTRDRDAGSNESRPLAQAEQDNVQGIEGKSNHNVIDGGDECLDQALAAGTPNACLFLSETNEQGPPSPLPSPPVPLSPTARQDSYFPRRLPPSFLLRQSEDCSQTFDDERSTLDVRNEAIEMNATIAQHGGPDENKVLQPLGHIFSESRAWDPVVGGRCASSSNSSSVKGDAIDHVSSQWSGYSPQPCRRRCDSLPETLSRDIKGQTNNHTPPEKFHRGEESYMASSSSPSASPGNTRAAFCDGQGIILATSPREQMSPSIPCSIADVGKDQPPLHGAQDGFDTSVPASSRHTAEEASATAIRTSLQQGEDQKTAAAAFTLQRWLRRVILASNLNPPEADVAAQTINEIPTVENGFKGLEPMDILPAAALYHSATSFLAPPSKDTVQTPSSGANTVAGEDEVTGHALLGRPTVSQRPVCSDVEESLLMTGMGNVSRAANPALREDKPSRACAVRALDQSHPFPPRRSFSVNDMEFTPGGRDSIGAVPVPSSREFGSNGEPSRPSRNIKATDDAGKGSAPRRASNTRQELNTRSPHGVGFVVPRMMAGVNEAPKTGPSVSFSLPSSSTLPSPLRLSSMSLTPILPRVPPAGLLKAGRNSSIHVRGCSRNQAPVENSSGWSRVEGRHAPPSSGFHHYQLKRQVAVDSAAPLKEGVALAEDRLEMDSGYSLTVLEAYLHRSRYSGRGNRASHGGPGCHSNQSKSCCPEAVAMAAKVPPVLRFPRPDEKQRPAASVDGAVSRHHVAVSGRGLDSNPLLVAWGVRNPLLNTAEVVATGSGSRCDIACGHGVAPHS